MPDRSHIVVIMLEPKLAEVALGAYRHIRQLQDQTSNARAARAQLCVFTLTKMEELPPRSAKVLKDAGVPLIDDPAVFTKTIAAVVPSWGDDPRWSTDTPLEFPGNIPLLRAACQDDCPPEKDDSRRSVYLVPESLVAKVFPRDWIERRALVSAFPAETFAKCEAKVASPFAKEAARLRNIHPDDPNVAFLEAVDDVIEHLPPDQAGRYVNALADRMRSTDVRSAEGKGVPRAGLFTAVDSLVYLALVGRLDIEVPKHIAAAASSLYFDWPESLDSLRHLGKAEQSVPEIPASGVAVSGIRVNEAHELVLHAPGGDIVLGKDWARRGAPLIGSVKTKMAVVEWPDAPPGESLMRVGMRLVWLGDEPPPERHPARGKEPTALSDLAGDLGRCVDAFRPFAHSYGDLEMRSRAWTNASDSADAEIVRRVAEGILGRFAPWPDPYTVRSEGDESWSWPSERCIERARELFKTLASAPIRQEPPNVAAAFLYLVMSPHMVCHVWPADVREGWHFKLKTEDHSWISGTVWATPPTREGEADPDSRLMIDEDKYSGRVALRSGRVACEITESR